MSDIEASADRSLKELESLMDRVASALKEVKDTIKDANDCFSKWDIQHTRARTISEGYSTGLKNLLTMDPELVHTVKECNQTSQDITLTEQRINADQEFLAQLNTRYLNFSEEIEKSNHKTVLIVSEMPESTHAESAFSLRKHLVTTQINTFFEAQLNQFRMLPDFKVGLFEPITIPQELLYASLNVAHLDDESVHETKIPANPNSNRVKNQQDNA